MPVLQSPADPAIAALRRFSRFYTRRIGALKAHLLDSPFSLTQARLLYEMGARQGLTAHVLCEELGLDGGYVSRLLKRFAVEGLIERQASKSDARRQEIGLTAAGRAAAAELDRRSTEEARAFLAPLRPEDQVMLTGALGAAERLLEGGSCRPALVTLREHRPGDMGWVVSRHGALYAGEYGWDMTFEALVAEIAAAFIRDFDAARECAFIAEADGTRLGCAFVMCHSDKVAKLRLLLVEPSARGLGLGCKLVGECVAFARASGYGKLILWTNDCLHAARRLYEQAGFVIVASEPHRSFGKDLVGETWELELAGSTA